MAVGSHKELSSLGSQKHRCCVRLAALCSFSSDVVLPRARCTTRLWALLLVIASAPRTRPLTPYAAAAAPSGLGAAPAARPPFSIKTPQRRFSGFQFSRPPPCLPVRGLFEKINLQEKRPARIHDTVRCYEYRCTCTTDHATPGPNRALGRDGKQAGPLGPTG